VTYEEAIDYDWRHIIHPDDAPRIQAESIAGEATLKPFVLEGRFRRSDGEWRWLRSISQPRWGPYNEHVGFIGVAHDITEWKLGTEVLEARVAERTSDLRLALDRLQAEVAERERAEEALRQAQKMEAVGQLTGGIAHDFNNLLTPVIGGLEILARSVETPRLKRIAEAALESGRRGAKLTTQLLAFSRLQRIRMAPVSVNRVIETMRLMLKHSIGGAVMVRTKLGADADFALCDENQLENAVLNLAINARDAMPEGGKLTIETCNTSLDESYAAQDAEVIPGQYVMVAVSDTGSGMPKDVVARAFEPFFTTKEVGKGTGLGLSMVYGFVKQSGGHVTIYSEIGQGTTVKLYFPRYQGNAAAQAVQEPSEIPTASGDEVVLVVEDNTEVRTYSVMVLNELGYKVMEANDAESALLILDSTARVDLLFTDVILPSKSGRVLADAARQRRPDLRVLYTTGYSRNAIVHHGRLDAGVQLISKPFTFEELAKRVRDVLDRG